MSETAIAKVITNRRSQTVLFPKEFRIEANMVRVRREGKTIVLEPLLEIDEWFAELDRLAKLTGTDFPNVRRQAKPKPKRFFD